MAENIYKLYRKGSWHNDPEEVRLKHVKTALERFFAEKDYDDLDLAWHIKNAVVGNIYFSEEVYNGIWTTYWKDYQNKKDTDQYRIISGIIERKTQRRGEDVFDDTFLDIRKWTGKNYSGVARDSDNALVFEHVIPAKVYLPELIKEYKEYKENNKEFDLTAFRHFRNKVSVCIVTKQEDNRLNESGFREKMPDGWNWQTGNPFARYEAVEIKIH